MSSQPSRPPLSQSEKIAAILAIFGGLALFIFFAARNADEPSETQKSSTVTSTHSQKENDSPSSLKHPHRDRQLNRDLTKTSLSNEPSVRTAPTPSAHGEIEGDDAKGPSRSDNTSMETLTNPEIQARAENIAASELAKLRQANQASQDELSQLRQEIAQHQAAEQRHQQLKKQLAIMRTKLDRRRNMETRLSKEITSLRNRLKHTPDDTTRETIEKLRRERNSARSAIRLLEQQHAKDKTEWNTRIRQLEMKRGLKPGDLDTLRKENQRLREQIARHKNNPSSPPTPAGAATPSSVFTRNIKDLPATQQKLFTTLSKLEGKPRATLDATYAALPKDLGASPITNITFTSGSITVTRPNRNKLTAALKNAPAGASFLVIGYASKKGDSDINQSLSSKRATAVARQLKESLPNGHSVKAIYLGETRRFGTSHSKNQLVEVWMLK